MTSPNALVKAKEQGIADFDALSAETHKKLDEIATKVNVLEGSINKVSLETRLEQCELLNEAFVACDDNTMTFGAWFSGEENKSVSLSVTSVTARKIIHLGQFCKNKNPAKITMSLTALYEFANPKWVKGDTQEEVKELKKARTRAYEKVAAWKNPRDQTGAAAKECILEERSKLGLDAPLRPTATKKMPTIDDMKNTLEGLLNDYRHNLFDQPEALEQLEEFVEEQMVEWNPDRVKSLPAPVLEFTDLESGYNFIDTLNEQEIRDIIAYGQEKLDEL